MVNGKASSPAASITAPAAGLEFAPLEDHLAEIAQARRLAERYRLEFVDMDHFLIDNELFRSIPADLMMIDELGALLATPVKVTVGTASAIQSILKKSESSQRVLEEATESFH